MSPFSWRNTKSENLFTIEVNAEMFHSSRFHPQRKSNMTITRLYKKRSALIKKKKKKKNSTTMKKHNIISVWHTSRVITSNVPRQRPNCPRTPASSRTSRRAVTAGSSSGSTPPPGTIQLSGLRLDVTSSTCKLHTVQVRNRGERQAADFDLDEGKSTIARARAREKERARTLGGEKFSRLARRHARGRQSRAGADTGSYHLPAGLPRPRDRSWRRYRRPCVCSPPSRRCGLNSPSPLPCCWCCCYCCTVDTLSSDLSVDS